MELRLEEVLQLAIIKYCKAENIHSEPLSEFESFKTYSESFFSLIWNLNKINELDEILYDFFIQSIEKERWDLTLTIANHFCEKKDDRVLLPILDIIDTKGPLFNMYGESNYYKFKIHLLGENTIKTLYQNLSHENEEMRLFAARILTKMDVAQLYSSSKFLSFLKTRNFDDEFRQDIFYCDIVEIIGQFKEEKIVKVFIEFLISQSGNEWEVDSKIFRFILNNLSTLELFLEFIHVIECGIPTSDLGEEVIEALVQRCIEIHPRESIYDLVKFISDGKSNVCKYSDYIYGVVSTTVLSRLRKMYNDTYEDIIEDFRDTGDFINNLIELYFNDETITEAKVSSFELLLSFQRISVILPILKAKFEKNYPYSRNVDFSKLLDSAIQMIRTIPIEPKDFWIIQDGLLEYFDFEVYTFGDEDVRNKLMLELGKLNYIFSDLRAVEEELKKFDEDVCIYHVITKKLAEL